MISIDPTLLIILGEVMIALDRAEVEAVVEAVEVGLAG